MKTYKRNNLTVIKQTENIELCEKENGNYIIMYINPEAFFPYTICTMENVREDLVFDVFNKIESYYNENI